MNRHRLSLAARVAIAAAMFLGAAASHAIVVNTSADDMTPGDGRCSLREATFNINATGDTTNGDCAAATGAGDTITFNLSHLPSTVALDLGPLTIHRDVDIVGPSTGKLTLDAAYRWRVLQLEGGRLLMSNLTIRGGSAFVGGGLHVGSGTQATLHNCLFTHNEGLYAGGMEVNFGGSAEINATTFDHNFAGAAGAAEVDGTATFNDCVFTRNGAVYDDQGGGGAVQVNGTATLNRCRFKSNSAYYGPGGALSNDGTTTMVDCTLERNSAGFRWYDGGVFGGGAIFNWDDSMLTVRNSTLIANRSGYDGGAILNRGTVTLQNSTFTRNRAGNGGGALSNLGSGSVTNCTLRRNRAREVGGGIRNDSLSLRVRNTILSESGARGNCWLPVTSEGHNLSSDDTCFQPGGTDLLSTQPRLTKLGDFGGPTKTFALCTGPGVPRGSCRGTSPALDAGDDAVLDAPENLVSDQRGAPRKTGLHVDMGAVEAP